MKNFTTAASIMVLVLLIGVLAGTTDPALAEGCFGGHGGKGLFSNLTDEQSAAIQEKREEMRSQGATREEIHEVVTEMLEGYGIEVPEFRQGPPGFGHGWHRFGDKLTDEQREAVRDKTEEMREQGATRQEIHDAVAKMFKEYGVELPERPQGWHGPLGLGDPWGGFGADLTDEQREAVRNKIDQMRDRGATREEIRAAVAEMLKGYGIELPENWDERPRDGHQPWLRNLTDEQRGMVEGKIKEMRGQNATREEIHSAIAEMLKEYGVELPERPPGWHDPKGLGPWNGCLGADLTDEQRKAVRQKVREMRSQGATREEIRTGIAGMLEEYGVELPDFMDKLTDEQRKTIRKRMREMKRQGVDCEEIRAAVAQMVQEYGFELPGESEFASSEAGPVELHIIAGSYPNPFNPETQISYTLNSAEEVQIQIYNIAGQLIRTYDMGHQPAGSHSVRWDGRNQSGDVTASGVYLYRIEAGPHQVTHRMVLLK